MWILSHPHFLLAAGLRWINPLQPKSTTSFSPNHSSLATLATSTLPRWLYSDHQKPHPSAWSKWICCIWGWARLGFSIIGVLALAEPVLNQTQASICYPPIRHQEHLSSPTWIATVAWRERGGRWHDKSIFQQREERWAMTRQFHIPTKRRMPTISIRRRSWRTQMVHSYFEKAIEWWAWCRCRLTAIPSSSWTPFPYLSRAQWSASTPKLMPTSVCSSTVRPTSRWETLCFWIFESFFVNYSIFYTFIVFFL